MTTPSERDLTETAGRLLRQTERDLDELTIARLRAARLRAVEQAGRRSSGAWLSGGAITAGLAFALAGLIWLTAPSDLAAPARPVEMVADLDLLLTKENPEFYADLEFYDWLASQPDAG
jgi:hypothetical protein